MIKWGKKIDEYEEILTRRVREINELLKDMRFSKTLIENACGVHEAPAVHWFGEAEPMRLSSPYSLQKLKSVKKKCEQILKKLGFNIIKESNTVLTGQGVTLLYYAGDIDSMYLFNVHIIFKTYNSLEIIVERNDIEISYSYTGVETDDIIGFNCGAASI